MTQYARWPAAAVSGNSFQTIAVPNGTSPVASSSTDTLTLTSADSSITITGNAGAKSVDFAIGTAARTTMPFVTKTTNYTVTTSDCVILSNHSAAVTYTLPTAASMLPSAGNGRFITIKDISGKASAFNIIIQANGAETMDGANTYTIKVDYQSITLFSDGTSWWIGIPG